MSDNPSPENDPDLKMIQECLDKLSNHFCTVHVFVTRYESDDVGTHSIQRGVGNWYARIGHIKSWLLRMNAQDLEKGRQDEFDEFHKDD